MSTRRIHFRPPGVKTGSRIGPLGPFRGTLSIGWVVGAIAVGLVLVLATTYAWSHGAPGPPYRRIATVDSFAPGSAREVMGGIFVGRATTGQAYAVADPAPNCPLEITGRGYRDCADLGYGLDGQPLGRGTPLPRLPLEVYRGDIYIDPTGGA